MYRSYSYNNMPQAKNTFKQKEKSAPNPLPVQTPSITASEKHNVNISKTNTNHSFISGLKNDDLILLAIICALLLNHCEDKLLLLALAYIFFSDYLD